MSQTEQEHKPLENDTERPEKFYEALINNAPDGVVLLGENFRISYVSPAAERLFGYSVEELEKMSPDDLTHPDDLAEVVKILQHLLDPETENFGTASYRFQRKDGGWRWIESTFTNLMQDPDIRGMVINFRDITDRVEAEIALKESEENFRKVLEESVQGILIHAKMKPLFVNQAFVEMLGFENVDEVLALDSVLSMIAPHERERLLSYHEDRTTGNSAPTFYEYDALSRDGATPRIQQSISAVQWDGEDAILSTTIDVTERRRAERDIFRLSRVFEDTINEIYLFDSNTLKFIQVNNAAIRNLGYTLEELLEITPLELKPKFTKELFQDLISPLLDGKVREVVFETVHKRKDETLYDVEVHLQLLEYEQEKLFAAIILDITERKKAEEQLQASESKYKALFDGISDAAFVHILQDEGFSTFLEVNETACQRLGYSREELLTLSPADISAPEDAKLRGSREGRAKLREDQWQIFEATHLTKHGVRLPVEISSRVFQMDGENVMVSLARDITDRKKAEEEISKLSKMVETTSQAIVITDVDGNVVYVNAALLSTLGYDAKEEIISKSMFEFTDEAGARKLNEEILPALHEVGHWQGEVGNKRKDGAIFPCDEVCSAILNEQGDVEFYVAAFVDISEKVQAREDIQSYIRRLDALRKIDQAIINSFDLRVTLSIILDYLISDLQVDAAAILKHDESTHALEFIKGQGFRTKTLRDTSLRVGRGYAGKVALERQSFYIPDLATVDLGISNSPGFQDEKFVSYYGVPLIAKGILVGVLEIFNRSPLEPDHEWVKYLETLAGQAAIAIDNIALFEDLERTNIRLVQSYDATIAGWAQALELRDRETEGHSRRVVNITLALAKTLGVSNADLTHIRRGALLHDIGKMGVSDEILQKPGKLTDEEWVIMKKHPVLAYKWLASIEYLRPALDIPYCHHEKWDGTGYPRGLEKEQIPIAARIFAVVDVWDALRSDRPYRKAWSHEKALAYIKEQSGAHFDPRVATTFLRFIENEIESR